MKLAPKILSVVILACVAEVVGYSQSVAPRIFFLDLDSGPNVGGENGLGVYVTLYGQNFGTTQGNSTVTLNGTAVASYKRWGDVIMSNDRTLQKITVQLGPANTSGPFVVKVNGVPSNSVGFTVRSGNIYVVATNGDDSANGSFASPWLTLLHARDTIAAGDTVYARNGVAQSTDDGQGWASCFAVGDNSGTSGSPKAIVGYPGETATIGNVDSSCGYGIRGKGYGENYWTFANLTLRGGTIAIGPYASNSWRVIGNDMSCPNGNGAAGCVDLAYTTNFLVYGNNVHNVATNLGPGSVTALYHGVYISEQATNLDFGWNTIAYVEGCRGLQQNVNQGNGVAGLLVHDNVIHDTQCDGIVATTMNPSQGGIAFYNNLIYNAGTGPNNSDGTGAWNCLNLQSYDADGAAAGSGVIQVFNNTMYNCGSFASPPYTGASGGFLWEGPNPNKSVNFVNNIIYLTENQPYISVYDSQGENCTSNCPQVTGSSNLFFGNGAAPVNNQLTNSLNVNPLFVSASGHNFQLQTASPAAVAGVNAGDLTDFAGLSLPQGSSYPIGALGVAGGGSFTPTVTGSITGTISPSSGGSGATVTLSGTASATTTTNASGSYSFTGLSNGTYTVTPGSTGYTLSPLSSVATINGGNQSVLNFTATAIVVTPPPTQTSTPPPTQTSTPPPTQTSTPTQIPAPVVISLTGLICNPAVVTPPASSTCQVTISSPAPSGGTMVTLSASSPNLSAAPLVVIPVNSTSASFSITATPVPSSTSIPVTAAVTNNSLTFPVMLQAQAPTPPKGIAVDVTASQNSPSASQTVTSPTFTTASSNELLLAFVTGGGSTSSTVTSVVGAGLNWVLAVRSNAQAGTAEIWRAFATTALSNVSVTATLSKSAYSSLTIMSFTGVDPSGVSGSGAIGATAIGSSVAGAPVATLTTTRDGSFVFAAGTDTSTATIAVPGPGQNIVHLYQTPSANSFWVQQEISNIPISGTMVSISDAPPSSDRYDLSAIEILPANGCAVQLVPQSRSFAASGGSNTSAVSDGVGCNWTATTDSPTWITLSGNSGTGNGTFAFSAAANSGEARVGTVSVGNQSFIVMQGGQPALQPFKDVPPTDPEFDYVSLMQIDGITSGCSTNPPMYCASTAVTRAEMAVFLVTAYDRATGNSLTYSQTPYFQDVPASGTADSIYFPFVQRIKDLGITAGCSSSPSLYCPDATITQGQMAVFMIVGWMAANNLTSFTYTQTPYFTDVPGTDPYFKFIQKMRDMGFSLGCSPSQYCENSTVTRDNMASMVMRAILGAP